MLWLSLAVVGLVLAPQATGGAASAVAPEAAGVVFAFSEDGNLLASAGEEGRITLVDLTLGEERGTLSGSARGAITELTFSPEGTLLAEVVGDTVTLWDLASGEERALLRGPGAITELAFSPEGTTVAGVVADRQLFLWDLSSGAQRWVFTSPRDTLREIAFSPDGTMLASGGVTATQLKLWEVASGQERLSLTNPAGAGIRELAFSPVGMTLASVDEQGTITLWDAVGGV